MDEEIVAPQYETELRVTYSRIARYRPAYISA